MKVFQRALVSTLFIFTLGFISTTHLTSCVKETIHDTVTVVERDTIRDTITRVDTVCELDLGLVAHYNFTGGSLLDETEYHNDIVFNNAAKTADRQGNADNAYLFDGNNSFMRVANSSSLNPQKITLMARVKVNGFYMGTCHFSDIFSKGYTDITQGFYVMRIADPYGRCYEVPDITKEYFVGGFGDNDPEGTAAGVAADTTFIQPGEWYTVVYTYDGERSNIYVNGKLQATQLKTIMFTPNDRDLFLGRHEDPAFPYWFNGVIDEMRIYNRAVSCYEAAALSHLCSDSDDSVK